MDITDTRLYKEFERRYYHAADKDKRMAFSLPVIEKHHEEYEKACAQKEALEKELGAAERKVSNLKSKIKQYENVGSDIFNAQYMEYAKQFMEGKKLLLVPHDMFTGFCLSDMDRARSGERFMVAIVNEVENATSISAMCRVDMFVYDPKGTGSRACINTSTTIHFDEIVEFLDCDKAATYINKAYKDLEGLMQTMCTVLGGSTENTLD
jgi:hypothetical protein